MTDPEAPIGLIAGRGALPLEVAAEARRQGRRVVCVDIFEADPRLPQCTAAYYPVPLGRLGGIIEAFRRHGVREVVLAGKVDKLSALRRVQLDACGESMARLLPDDRDTSIVGAFLAMLETSGFQVGPQTRYLGHLVPGPGVLTPRAPSQAEAADIQVGLRIASQIAALDIGQTVAVHHGAVIAVEAAEGTDEMIRRVGALGAGCVIAKVSRPRQDPRYDLPVVGPGTIKALAASGGTALAVEAGRTLLLERDQVVSAAAAAGIAIIAADVPRVNA